MYEKNSNFTTGLLSTQQKVLIHSRFIHEFLTQNKPPVDKKTDSYKDFGNSIL